MNSRLILVMNSVIQRRLLPLTEIITRNLTCVTHRYREQKSYRCLHKNWDMSYSQYRCFHHSNLLYKRRKTKEERKMPKEYLPPISKHKQKKVIEVWKNMTVKELAGSMDLSVDDLNEVMDYVENTDNYYKPNHVIDDFNTLQSIVKKLGFRWLLVPKKTDEEVNKNKDIAVQPPPDPSVLVKRPPVVTIMGHVDHGKTTLLDRLRNSSVVDSEFGGITQHIGAFSVKYKDEHKITFLDTPGHAAFTAMRSRGANVTDIVVLVVAADDGVMDQTKESIRMAKEAEVAMVVAINKIDKPQANIEKTKSMLLQHEIVLEDYGGDIQSVPISALKGENIDSLVEAILLQAEILELKGDPNGLCEGVVIESKHDNHRGKLATVLVQRGTLKKGKIIVAGIGWAKVRSMLDDNQQVVLSADPSTAVEITGWRELPSAGDIVLEVETEKRARGVIDWRLKQKLEEKSQFDLKFIEEKKHEQQEAYKEQLLARRKLGRYRLKRTGPRPKEIPDIDEGPQLSIIIKGDCDGSVEAIVDILGTYRSSLCKLSVVHFEVGSVSLSDVELAEAFDAIIYAFNVDVLSDAEDAAKRKEVPIHNHNIIYRLFEDMKNEFNNRLPLIDVSEVIGEAEVMQQFIVTDGKKKVPVAGSKCTSGYLKKKGTVFKVVRENEVLHEGPIESLRHLKDEVDVIKREMDCGIRFSDLTVTFQPKDKIICLLYSKKKQVIDWNPGF